MTEAFPWFDELELDPTVSWRRMGTRALSARPWLVSDDRAGEELRLRAELFRHRRDEVFVPAPRRVADEVWELVARIPDPTNVDERDGLARAGLTIQEDLCLLQHHDSAWHLDAAFVCFPSRWRLADKVGRPLVDVHAPTPGYPEHLAHRVDRLLDKLTDRPVLRRNWFVHPDPALHQPTAPPVDPVVPAADVASSLHVRSERQTLRRLPSGWILFTIRVQQAPLGCLLDHPLHGERTARYVAGAPLSDLAHRGMSPEQVDQICRSRAMPTRGDR